MISVALPQGAFATLGADVQCSHRRRRIHRRTIVLTNLFVTVKPFVASGWQPAGETDVLFRFGRLSWLARPHPAAFRSFRAFRSADYPLGSVDDYGRRGVRASNVGISSFVIFLAPSWSSAFPGSQSSTLLFRAQGGVSVGLEVGQAFLPDRRLYRTCGE